MAKCSYCKEEMPMPSRHEPNCNLNPYFQNRFYQLPREQLFHELQIIENEKHE